jgi:hypothetical protein
MHRFVRVATAWVAVVGGMALGGSAGAEGFMDLRVGGAFSSDGNASVSGGGMFQSGRVDDSFTTGLRGGYWFDFSYLRWLGLAGDVSFFAPHQSGSGGVDIYVLPFTPLLMARLPLLTSDELPNGRLQPYAAIGPGIFTTVVYEDSTDYTAAGVDVGLDVRAGLNVQILKWLGVFAEYRYTSYEADVDDDVFGVNVQTELDLDSHHVAAGVGFHF